MIIFPVWTCCYCFGYCGNVLMILMLLFGSDLKQEGKQQQQDFLSVRPAEGFLLLFLSFLKPVKGFLGSFFIWGSDDRKLLMCDICLYKLNRLDLLQSEEKPPRITSPWLVLTAHWTRRPQGSAPFTASPPIRFENEDWKCSAEEVQSASSSSSLYSSHRPEL